MPIAKPCIALYRGHTHGEFAFMPESPIARAIGDWVRNVLTEREFIPEGFRWDPIRKVRVFNHAHWEMKRMFAEYNRMTNRLHVPIRACNDIKNLIESRGGEVTELLLPSYPVRKIDVKMRPGFNDREEQKLPIQQCSDQTPGVHGVQLQTGKGKTYIGVKSAVNLGCPAIIIVPGLVDQWIQDIAEYTDAKIGGNIYKIEGFDTFAFLAKNPTYRPDFFVASTRTMQMFSNRDEGYELLPWDYAGFFREYGIGTKIIDECHKQFHAVTMMDLKVNVPHNLYLSATFDQTAKQARAIFERIFPEEIKVSGCEYDRYVTVHFYNFYGEIDERRCRRAKGYMHALYETELMRSTGRLDSHLEKIVDPLLEQHFARKFQKGHKCLVFCSTIEFVNYVVDHFKKLHPELKILPYVGNSTRDELLKADIAVSTLGKASTGLDWKGLRCCINTVSVRSPVLTSQMLGRLRKINGEQLTYVDICDCSLQSQCRHAEDRKRDLRRMAVKYYEYNGLSDTAVFEESAPAPGSLTPTAAS